MSLRVACIVLLASGGAASQEPPRKNAWLRVNAGPFIVFGEVEPAEILDAALRLEEFRARLDAAVPELSAAAYRPAYVFAFANSAALEPYRPSQGESERGSAGIFIARVDRDFLLFDLSAAPSIDRPSLLDYARFVVENNLAAPPSWLVEGRGDRGYTVSSSSGTGTSSPSPEAEATRSERLFSARGAAPSAAEERRTIPVSRAESLARLGDLLAQVDPSRFALAEDHLRSALELDPANATALLAYARLDHMRRRWNAAAGRYEAALAMGGAAAATQYGWMLLDRWDAEHTQAALDEITVPPSAVLSARTLFQRALALCPDDPLALHGLGRTYLFGQARDPAAAAALTRAHKLFPARAEITLDLIRLDAAAGRIDAATALFDSELRRRAAAPELVHKAERALAVADVNRAAEAAAAGRPEAGRAILQDALGRSTDADVRALLADNLSQFQASASIQRLAATLNDASAAVGRGDYESAWRLYEHAARLADDAQVKRNAEAMVRTTQRQAAANRAAARVAKAISRANEGDIAGALADLNAVLRDEPDMPAALKSEAKKARDRFQAALQRR